MEVDVPPIQTSQLTPGNYDIPKISAFLELPQVTIESLAGISESFVTAILEAVTTKARFHDELKADKLRLEVELEQNTRTSNARVNNMKARMETSQTETQDLRKQVAEFETKCRTLEADLSHLRTSTSSSTEETRTLKARISTLESEKRETLEAYTRKLNEIDDVQAEYSRQQTKILELRREISTVESRAQQAESAQTSAKFREQTIRQELEIVKKNNEWLENELSIKQTEHSKYRKERSAQVSQLERNLEDAQSKSHMAEQKANSLTKRYEEVCHKVEESQLKIKALTEDLASREDDFRTEISNAKRLADLWENSTKSARDRIKQLEDLREQQQSQTAEEVGRVQALNEALKEEQGVLHKKIQELEVQIERLETDLGLYASGAIQPIAQSPAASRRGRNAMTPVRGTGTPERHLVSPAAHAIVMSQKSGMSLTEVYTDYAAVKRELEAANNRNQRLQESFDELIHELEDKGPEFENQKAELDRAAEEIVILSELLQEANNNNERGTKELKSLKKQLKEDTKQIESLKQQIRDSGSQIQFLLAEVQHLSQGMGPMSAADQARFRKMAIQGISMGLPQTDTDRLISERLVVFANIKELQEQNSELLRAARAVGKQLEDHEVQMRMEAEGAKTRELQEMQQTLDGMRDEIRSLEKRAETFVRERDMFRRMLQHRNQLPAEMQADNETNALRQSTRTEPETTDKTDYGQLLRELQQSFDQYKMEASTDQKTLREQANVVQNEKNELQIQLTRINGQLELAASRYEMLGGNLEMMNSENRELRKRNQELSDLHAKLDLRSQQIEQELVENRSILDSVRNDNVKLKAEKDLWKNIEERLAKDNDTLLSERAQLKSTINSLQAMQTEKEQLEIESKRRLTSQLGRLEGELESTKKRLTDEVEETRKLQLRRDTEATAAQKKIDEVNAALASAREGMVAAKTTQDHLQSRVDELQISLKAAEEKISVLQPQNNHNVEEEALSREQDLQIEMSELTRNLELARADLESARADVEKYKEISQSSEDALESINASHETYVQDTEQQLEEKSAKIQDLEKRVQEITAELQTSNEELTNLRQEQAENVRIKDDQLKLLESEIASLKEEVQSQIVTSKRHQDDLKRQAQIAQEAQQSYEQELMKHAQAADALQKIRAEYTNLKMQVHGFKTEAETARSMLESSATSWETQKETYEKELKDVRARCDDLVKQNKLVHDQFEVVSQQIADLQKDRERAIGELAVATSDQSLEELRAVITYLRREKEIVDVQLELQTQEAKRIKVQLDHTRKQLDEVRVTLSEERARETEAMRLAAQNEEIKQKMGELTVIRESNVTLRAERDKFAGMVEQLRKEAADLKAKMEPLEEKIAMLEGDVEVKDGQMKLLQEDNERWKARTNQILQKYDRIDPAELEGLKDQLKSVQEELQETQAKLAASEARLQASGTEIQTKSAEAADLLAKEGVKWKARLDKLVAETKEKLAARRQLIEEQKREITDLKQTLEQTQAAATSSSANSEEALNQARAALETEMNNLQQQFQAHQTQQAAEIQRLTQELADCNVRLEEARSQASSLEAQLSAARAAQPPSTDAPAVSTEQIEAEVERRISEKLPEIEAKAAAAAAAAAAATSVSQPASEEVNTEAIVEQRLSEEKQRFEEEKRRLRESYTASARNHVSKMTAAKDKELADVATVKDKEIADLKAANEQLGTQVAELQASVEAAKTAVPAAEGAEAPPPLPAAPSSDLSEIEAQLRTELQTAQEKIETIEKERAEVERKLETTSAAQKRHEENMKAIIKKNVEARVSQQREKLDKEFAEKLEAAKKELPASDPSQAPPPAAPATGGESNEAELNALKEKHAAELLTRDQEITKKLEDARESGRKEMQMRTRVQVSMLEKKNKDLTEKVKSLEGAPGAQLTLQSPGHPPPSQLPQPGAPIAPAFGVMQRASTPNQPPPAFGQQTPQVAPAFGQSHTPQQHQQLAQPSGIPQPGGNQGTGPSAIKNMRGGIQSGIPRGGGNIRGAFGAPRGGMQPGIPQPQSIQAVFGAGPAGQPQSQLPRGGAAGRGAFGHRLSRGGPAGIAVQPQSHPTPAPSGIPVPGQNAPNPLMNAQARAFTPTTGKRTREDGEIVDDDPLKRQKSEE
ncbi:hypothetical protein AOL_s00054g704 [Orbilia oligospora ATCC 24927]|uniref:Uncharacterized protein n=1 Tax=Arthrobotrys oligospora (strain ATCC 24927 / CBS 115.81 / DSM 1491) TaxID=756982 RepID=G1X760_ARTOA|nr:hypothetical protein AOL_s00054g704 [Orbilia oligospora ATCC 24927]EGX50968.1 hypothetical protein AOL_s00054g704 [Orbilia oligospora ATCC 24927]